MIKTYVKRAVIIVLMGLSPQLFSQTGNISINLAGNKGSSAAILDLSDPSNSSLGFLLPNVTLVNATSSSPVTSPPVGLIVFNTSTSTSNGLFGQGLYYWSGSAWLFVNSGGAAAASYALSSGTGISSFTYNGSAPATVALANTTIAPGGTYGSTSIVPQFTVNAQGQITAETDETITPASIGMQNLTQGTGITPFTYNGSSPATIGLASTITAGGPIGSATTVPVITYNAEGQLTTVSTATIPTATVQGATNGLSISGTNVILGGTLTQATTINPSTFGLTIDGGTVNINNSTGGTTNIGTGGTGNVSIGNISNVANTVTIVSGTTGGVTINNTAASPTDINTASTGEVNIGNSTGKVGINEVTPGTQLDVNGSFATRPTTVSISSSGQVITVGNSSHIIMTSSNTTISTAWNFTLSAGTTGQYLVLEMTSGYAELQNTGNVKLYSVATFTAYGVLCLKWDGTYWVELSRNLNILNFLPVALSGSPPTSYNGKQIFNYTGSNQTFTVPSYVSQIYIKMWAAGGGGGYYGEGGSGAYIGGYYNVTGGNTYTIVVGGGGVGAANSASGGFGGGGSAGTSSSGTFYGGGGGGRSSIQAVAGTDAVTVGAGGGGGSEEYNNPPGGGTGGATTGGNGITSATAAASGIGGTTSGGGAAGTGSVAGTAGTQYQGGNSGNSYYTGGGGGGGYYGGGGSASGANSTAGEKGNAGGGGGSSYVANLVAGYTNTQGNSSGSECTSSTPPNTGDADYNSNSSVGIGGYSPACINTQNGGPGEVVIIY